MSYVCKKPMVLSGMQFSTGDMIPEGCILPARVSVLIRNQYIAEVNGEAGLTPVFPLACKEDSESNLIIIPIITKEGSLELPMTSQEIIKLLYILQLAEEETIGKISKIENETLLILIDRIKQRKKVKEAVTARVEVLKNAEHVEPDSEQTGESKGDA